MHFCGLKKYKIEIGEQQGNAYPHFQACPRQNPHSSQGCHHCRSTNDITGKCRSLCREPSGGREWRERPAVAISRLLSDRGHIQSRPGRQRSQKPSLTVWGGSTLFHRNGFMEMGVKRSAGKPLIGNLRCADTCRPEPVLHEREVTARPNHGRDMTRCRLPPPC